MSRKLMACVLVVSLVLPVLLFGCGTLAGEPVTVKFLIRNNDKRLEIGNYVANQLEELGFKVERQYGGGGDLAPIWLGDPTAGEWNVYTGAWINTAVPRDEGSNFGAFYTPLWSAMGPLWAAYTPSEEFLDVATKLWNNDFSTMDEREALFEQAVPMSMQDSVRIFLDDRASFYPLRANVAVGADAYGGITGSGVWASTIHFHSNGVPQVPTGSTVMKIALEDLLIDPWNAIAGSNWAFDQFPMRGTYDTGMVYDIRDGLVWPDQVDKAEVVVQEGLPVSTNPGHDWCTLSFSDGPIPVPASAWYDWDATTGNWITAGPGKTAKTKVTVYYPKGTFGLPLHDGSTLDEGDFLLAAVIGFDRAKPESFMYDKDYVAEFDAFMEHFKGVEFNFNDPNYDLVVTTYDDQFQLDAELMAYANRWFPNTYYGPIMWHTIALGMLAEKDLQLAFSQAKAEDKGCEWLGFQGGPSIDILQSYLTKVLTSGDPSHAFIPYPNVLGAYITQAEALARYNSLQAFKNQYGHFWVAGGPYYLESIDTAGDVITLKRFAAYPSSGDKFFFMMDPEPTNPPAHTGAWVDTVVITKEESADAAVRKLQAGQLDVYAGDIQDAALFETVKGDSSLRYYLSAGLYDELTFNPSGPFFPGTGKLNPFALPAVREALNYAIDREHIAGEIYGGQAYPRYTCVGTVTGDYLNRYPNLFKQIEQKYAYDFEKADADIEAAMLTIPGVTRQADGKYYYTTS
ncbi:MAG: ABC transporter substrate-binding protein [Anaerolineae bacterium]